MAGKDDTTPHEIVHGTKGEATLEHTQHEAPMPKIEKGDGVDLSSTPASKPHGSSGPTSHEKSSSSKDSHSTSKGTSTAPSSGTGGSHGTYASVVRDGAHEEDASPSVAPQQEEKKKGGKSTLPPNFAADSKESSDSTGSGNKYDQVDRDNAEKFGGVNLDNEGKKGHSSSGGSHEKKSGSGSGHEEHHHEAKKESSKGSEKSESKGEKHDSGANKFDLADRDKAEKFGGINLSE